MSLKKLKLRESRLLSLLIDYRTVAADLALRGAEQMAEYMRGMANQIVLELAEVERQKRAVAA